MLLAGRFHHALHHHLVHATVQPCAFVVDVLHTHPHVGHVPGEGGDPPWTVGHRRRKSDQSLVGRQPPVYYPPQDGGVDVPPAEGDDDLLPGELAVQTAAGEDGGQGGGTA